MAYEKKRMAKAILFFCYSFFIMNLFPIDKLRFQFNGQSVAIYRQHVGILASQYLSGSCW